MIIGLSGYARAGKDTAGQALVACGFTRVSFADKLREFLYALDPLVGTGDGASSRLTVVISALGWEDAKDAFPDVRGLLQRCGTDAGRRVLGENVWVDAVMRDLPEKTVITDVRFPNEAQAIKDRGGRVVRVERPGCEPVNPHESETALNDWPFDSTLYNVGDIEELRHYTRLLIP